MIKTPNKAHFYDEEVAIAFIHNEEYDNCIIYCLPMVHGYLKHHHWSFLNPSNYDDVSQELAISLVGSIRSYDPNNEKHAKLITWMYVNFRFACLAYAKKEKPFQDNNMQLEPDAGYSVPAEVDMLQLEEDLYYYKQTNHK